MRIITPALFVSGIILAGSDGDWFPWINLVGCALFMLFGLAAKKYGRI